MARKFGNTTGRQVGKKSVTGRRELTDEEQVLLGALVAYCQSRDCAVFVGTVGTTRSMRLNLYPGDDKCVGALGLGEDWTEMIPALLSDVFEEPVSLKDIERAVPWLARTVADGSPATNPTRGVGSTALKSQGPS